MCLTTIIRDTIREKGPISFHDFMEMALYYPDEGYYTSDCERIGKQGDFYTSAYLTTLFGKLIARQMEEMWALLGKRPFTIVEYGAGTGLLCCDILEHLRKNKSLYHHLSYYIIEKSAAMRTKQKALLPEKVSWINNINEVAPINGCVLSNEVVDNFAVHQVVMDDELMEVHIEFEEGFREVLKPASSSLKNYFEELGVELPRGFRTEINLEAIQWMQEIGTALGKGFAITIDYGFPSTELYTERRSRGTVVCYHKHQVNFCPYDHIGEQDITTHINFSALQHWGKQNGLEYAGYTSQAYFLLGLGLTQQLAQMERTADHGTSSLMLHTFLHDMGRKMKVLVQKKGVNGVILSGLQFCERL